MDMSSVSARDQGSGSIGVRACVCHLRAPKAEPAEKDEHVVVVILELAEGGAKLREAHGQQAVARGELLHGRARPHLSP